MSASSLREPNFAAVVLAGGSGTRFWPRSRRARAKQVLQLDGEQTMIQDTVSRLGDLVTPNDVWVITNDLLAAIIAEQLPTVTHERLVLEPEARNTAPACALAAFLLARTEPDTVLGVFPSDHVIGDVPRFRAIVRAATRLAANDGTIVVLGVPPTRAETGYGYIELGAGVDPVQAEVGEVPVRRVRRFTEKPDVATAQQFVDAGNYVWNSGIFFWSAHTLVAAITEHKPAMAAVLTEIAADWGLESFKETFARLYPQCESVSIDYAVLEPRSAKGEQASGLFCLPADFVWNDLGSWAALYEHRTGGDGLGEVNVLEAPRGVEIQASGCYVYSPKKTVALVGVSDLIVVETEDALLITTRDGSQNVGKVVAELRSRGHHELI